MIDFASKPALHNRRREVARSEMAKLVSRGPKPDSGTKISDERRELIESILRFAQATCGRLKIVSAPGCNPLTVEVIAGSSRLAEKLEGAGELVHRYQETRTGGTAAHPEEMARWRKGAPTGGYGTYSVDIFTLRLK